MLFVLIDNHISSAVFQLLLIYYLTLKELTKLLVYSAKGNPSSKKLANKIKFLSEFLFVINIYISLTFRLSNFINGKKEYYSFFFFGRIIYTKKYHSNFKSNSSDNFGYCLIKSTTLKFHDSSTKYILIDFNQFCISLSLK